MDPKKYSDEWSRIKCDKCGCTCGLYQFAAGKWRCPACMWEDWDKAVQCCCRMSDFLAQWRSGLVGVVMSEADFNDSGIQDVAAIVKAFNGLRARTGK